jgi:DNA-binding transcriptional MerR regulator
MKIFSVKVTSKYPALTAKTFIIVCTSAGTAIGRAIRKYRQEIGKKRLYSLNIECDLIKKRPKRKKLEVNKTNKAFNAKTKPDTAVTENYKNEEIKKITIGELSKEKKIGKSLLHYYAKIGLIVPIEVVGRMQIYNENELRERLKTIERYKKQGIALKKIKELLNPSLIFSSAVQINSNRQKNIFNEPRPTIDFSKVLSISKNNKKFNQDGGTSKELLNIKKAAEFIGVCACTLRKWEKDGIISPKRIGTRNDRRYTKEQLLALLVNKH